MTGLRSNPGASITNAAETVYPKVRDRFPLARVMLEHSPRSISGERESEYDLIELDGSVFKGWRPVSEDDVHLLLLGGVPEPHESSSEPAWIALIDQPAPLTFVERTERELQNIVAESSEATWLTQLRSETAVLDEVEYTGRFDDRGKARILRRDATGRELLTHYIQHSPSGFAWGDAGSGAAEAARCMLIDALGLKSRANADWWGEFPEVERLYQAFKLDFITPLDAHDSWVIGKCNIMAWYDAQPRERKPALCEACRAPLSVGGECHNHDDEALVGA